MSPKVTKLNLTTGGHFVHTWEPNHSSTFFFRPPAHLCAVTNITEILLNVTLSYQFNQLTIEDWEKKLSINFRCQRSWLS